MPKLPAISGRKLIKALTRLGFVIVRQKGSHVFLQRGEDTTVVPLHKEIKKPTLKKILKQANVSLDDLLEEL
ncbi:MAG: type II toxin-antitoxin system HicA family toxin [Thermoplasmata archaeon]|nr:MAG: type II toxin-antitoxin system HicA family toxin [Thermoplasmata archaeon]